MKILVYGEGPQDVGRGEDEYVGVVRTLVERLITECPDSSDEKITFRGRRLGRLHGGKGFKRKARIAINEARRQGYDCVVIVIDRDGRRQKNGRLQALNDGRDEALRTAYFPTAIGVAIETMEAWLLADERALSECLGRAVDKQPSPEKLSGKKGTPEHPKTRLNTLIDGDDGKLKQRIAEQVDLPTIERRCPKGFKPFADEIRAHLCPALS
jgi:hypothetical protein